MPGSKEWAFDKASMYSQITGTFRNALSQRMDQTLLPVLAKVIGLIDKNYNLSIIHSNRNAESITSPLARIWLEFFSNRNLLSITYKDVFTEKNIMKPNKWVPGIGASLSDYVYKCKFPFSWICQDTINSQKKKIASGI